MQGVIHGEVMAPAFGPAITGQATASGDFTQGANGATRMAWQQLGDMGAPFLGSAGNGYGSYGGLLGTSGSRLARQASLASSVSLDMLTSDPIIASIVLAKLTAVMGIGLSLSSKPDAKALNITEVEASDLAGQIERAWRSWSTSPRECDAQGQSDIHALAAAGFTSWLIAGELLATVEVQECRDAQSLTKIWLLDANQLDRTRSIQSNEGNAINGVEFNLSGRIVGYWIRDINPGRPFETPMPRRVPNATSWGRPKVMHLFDKKLPGQVRGLSPLTPSLTSAAERNLLGEYTLTAALIQTGFAATVESDLPPSVAVGGIDSGTYRPPGATGAGVAGYDPNAGRLAYYGQNEVTIKPGKINFMAQGDKLTLHSAKTPNSAYKDHHDSLLRQAAKASGASAEDVSGDYSKTSFSASRLATELPYRITLRERNNIVIPFYKAVFRAWLEEAIERGKIKLPRKARHFWEEPDAYCMSDWHGPGRVQADPKKAGEADVLEIENGLATMSSKLAERGLDFDEVLAQRKREKAAIEAAGLKGWTPGPGTVTTQNRTTIEEIKED